MSALDLIADAIVLALKDQADEVQFLPMGDPSEPETLHIFCEGWSPIEHEASVTRYEARFEIAGYVDGIGGAGPAKARTALHVRTVQRLMADETLGGIAELIEDGDLNMFTAMLTSVERLAFSQHFIVQFVTPRGDPSRIA